MVKGGDPGGIEGSWPVEVLVQEPREGRSTGHQQFKQFVKASAAWLGERQARAEAVATTTASGRIVVELLAHLVQDGRRIDWPLPWSPNHRATARRSSSAPTASGP